jgi:hypothetical protein
MKRTIFDLKNAHNSLFACPFLNLDTLDALRLRLYRPLIWDREMLSIFPFIRWLSTFELSPGQPIDPSFTSLPNVVLY